jgi:hypothetical protein
MDFVEARKLRVPCRNNMDSVNCALARLANYMKVLDYVEWLDDPSTNPVETVQTYIDAIDINSENRRTK